MSSMKRTIGIGWRHNNGKRLSVWLGIALFYRSVGVEIASILPHLVNAVFGLFWIVGFIEFFFHMFCASRTY